MVAKEKKILAQTLIKVLNLIPDGLWKICTLTFFLLCAIWHCNFLLTLCLLVVIFCCLLMICANSLDPDQDWQAVHQSWSEFKPFDTLTVLRKDFLKKVNFEKSQQMTTITWKITQHEYGNYISDLPEVIVGLSLKYKVY